MDGQTCSEGNFAHKRLEQIFAMNKGQGEASYSKNSTFQASTIEAVLPGLEKYLELVTPPAHGPLVVADFGCSSGPNTINSVDFIVKKLKAILAGATSTQREFQGFFNDLPSNDFNNLFQLLASDPRTSSNRDTNLFFAAVPGSFINRLFPCSSIHVCFSAHALHWMSKIPDSVLDKQSPAFNNGTLWIDKSRPEVVAEFREQSASDLKSFLNARATELAPGGLLFALFNGKPAEPYSSEAEHFMNEGAWCLIDDAWTELVSEGILTEEQRDNLNWPIYLRKLEDVQEVIKDCASAFEVVSVKLLPLVPNLPFSQEMTLAEMASLTKLGMKSILNELVECTIGKAASDMLWERYERLVLKHEVPKMLLRNMECVVYRIVVCLIRK